MIKNLFTESGIIISGDRFKDGRISLAIDTDYSGSSRKSPLYVNEKYLTEKVEEFWKSIKTKKLLSMSVGFYEIDWYDDMTDIYETPVVRIERGMKRAKVGHKNHGSIPKDWGVRVFFTFDDTKANTPILEVVNAALGSFFVTKKDFVKALKPFLQKKVTGFSV